MKTSPILRLLIKHYARDIVRSIYTGLLQVEPNEEALTAYVEELRKTGELEPIIRDLAASRTSWEAHLYEHPDALIRFVFQGLLGREPDPEALRTYSGDLAERKDLGAVLSAVGQSQEHWEKLLGHKAEELIKAVYQGLLKREPDPEGLRTYSQTLAENKNLSEIIRSIDSSPEKKSKTGTNYLPELINGSIFKKLISPETISHLSALAPHLGEDLYQQSLLATIRLHQNDEQKRANKPDVVFVWRNPKEKKSLEPIHNALRLEKWDIPMLSLREALEHILVNQDTKFIFVVSIEEVARWFKILIPDCTVVYVEHGAAPLKRYTYASHYNWFDYSLLPGQLWVDRLEKLYPSTKKRFFDSGYPALSKHQPTTQEVEQFYKERNLDPSKKTVLFAPTWSDGDKSKGVFLSAYLQSEQYNVIVVPHEGDIGFVKSISSELPTICFENGEKNISWYYSFTDLLITDISSTAVEFARLGKPVACIKQDHYSDYDPIYFDENGTPRIPHTGKKWSDYFAMYPIDQIIYKLDQLKWADTSDMCSIYGEEAALKAANIIRSIRDGL